MFAGDTRFELLTVDGPANEAKGDSGPAVRMPPNPGDVCAYVTRPVTALAAYHSQ